MQNCKVWEYQSLRELLTKTEDGSAEKDVLNQISSLSIKLFGEDVVEDYGAPGKVGRLWALYDFGSSDEGTSKTKFASASCASMSTEPSVCDGDDNHEIQEPGYGGRPRLLGFLVARLMNKTNMPRIGGEALSVVYAAVPEELRGNGIGSKLVKMMVATGRERKNIALITLSSLPVAIQFWTRCGFVVFPDAMELKEGMVQGQVYMEANVRGRKKGTKHKTKKKKPMFM